MSVCSSFTTVKLCVRCVTGSGKVSVVVATYDTFFADDMTGISTAHNQLQYKNSYHDLNSNGKINIYYMTVEKTFNNTLLMMAIANKSS